MKKTIASIVFVSALILTALLATYVYIPQLAKVAIERYLPDNIQLNTLAIERPSLSRLMIKQLQLTQLPPRPNQVDIRNLSIEFDLLQFIITKITAEQVSVLLDSIVEASNETEGSSGSNLSEFELPELVINQLHIEANLEDLPKINAQGAITIDEHNLNLDLEISSTDKLSGKVGVAGTEWKKFVAKTTLNHFDLKLLEQLRHLIELPTSEFEGVINLDLDTAFHVEGIPESIVDLDMKTLSLDKLIIDHLTATASLHELKGNTEQISLTGWNGKLSITKDDHWKVLDSRLTGKLDISKIDLPIESSLLLLNATLNSIELKEAAIYSDVSLTVDNIHHTKIASVIPINLEQLDTFGQSSSHKIAFELTDLNRSVSPLLDNINIHQLGGQASFTLIKNPDWIIEALSTKDIVINKLQFKDEIKLFAESIKPIIKWKTQFSINDNPFQESTLDINDALFEYKPYKLSSRFKLAAKIKRIETNHQSKTKNTNSTKKDTYQFNAKVDSNDQLPYGTSIALDGEFQGALELNNELTFKTKAVAAIQGLTNTLTILQPDYKKLFGQTTINDGQAIKSDITMSGQLQLNSQTPVDSLRVKGSIHSQDNRISMGDNRADQLMFDLSWKELQPWSTFALETNSQLLYQGVDTQRHSLTAGVQLLPELKVKGINLQSQLLDGMLIALTPDAYLPLTKISGNVQLKEISLKKISTIIDNPDLTMAGEISGAVPFSIEEDILLFQKGELKSNNGVIEYLPEGRKITLTKDNMSDIANITLQNFHYTVMDVTLVSGGPCDLNFKIRLEGTNPDLVKNQTQIFNIDYHPVSNVNLYYLLLLGEDNIKNLDEKHLYSGCVQDSKASVK